MRFICVLVLSAVLMSCASPTKSRSVASDGNVIGKIHCLDTNSRGTPEETTCEQVSCTREDGSAGIQTVTPSGRTLECEPYELPKPGQQNCVFEGMRIPHNTPVRAYRNKECHFTESEIRHCKNGTLEGSNPYSIHSCDHQK